MLDFLAALLLNPRITVGSLIGTLLGVLAAFVLHDTWPLLSRELLALAVVAGLVGGVVVAAFPMGLGAAWLGWTSSANDGSAPEQVRPRTER
jgi:putative flippase GtrA